MEATRQCCCSAATGEVECALGEAAAGCCQGNAPHQQSRTFQRLTPSQGGLPGFLQSPARLSPDHTKAARKGLDFIGQVVCFLKFLFTFKQGSVINSHGNCLHLSLGWGSQNSPKKVPSTQPERLNPPTCGHSAAALLPYNSWQNDCAVSGAPWHADGWSRSLCSCLETDPCCV